MSNFKAGFARLDVTPPFGVNISGYYEQRVADGILDNLYASAIAVSDGFNTAVIISADVIGIPQVKMNDYRKSVAERNSISFEAVFVAINPIVETGMIISKKNINTIFDNILFEVNKSDKIDFKFKELFSLGFALFSWGNLFLIFPRTLVKALFIIIPPVIMYSHFVYFCAVITDGSAVLKHCTKKNELANYI